MKKKQWLTVLLATISMASVQAQEKYVIEGSVHPAPNNLTLHLLYNDRGKGFKHDSAKVVQGKFSFAGELSAITLAYLAVPPDNQSLDNYMKQHQGMPAYQIGIYLEKGTINLSLNATDQQSVVVKGTPNNDVMQASRAIVWKYNNREDALTKLPEYADSIQKQKAIQEYNQINKERIAAMGAFIAAHPNTMASLDLLKRWINPSTHLAEARQYYGHLSDDLKNSKTGLGYGNMLKQSARVDIDSLAPDFQLADTAGLMHHLTDYKGKYVLIDFWASWCVPCMKEMPNVVKAYDTFKSKNLEIIGVSLDGQTENARTRWINSFMKAGMTWPQWSDLGGWSSAPAQLYKVSAIPANFLISPAGKIIAKDLRGQELTDVLTKYL